MPELTGKLKRKLMAHYIDASETSTASYVRLGKDLEEYTVEMNANVEKKTNILGEVSVIIDKYEKQESVEPYYAEYGDALFEKLQSIIDEEKTLDDLKTTVLDVHLWEEGQTSGTFVAYREDAIIEVTSYGGDTTGYQIPFNVHRTGNRVKGEFDPTTKTFTPDGAPAPEET